MLLKTMNVVLMLTHYGLVTEGNGQLSMFLPCLTLKCWKGKKMGLISLRYGKDICVGSIEPHSLHLPYFPFMESKTPWLCIWPYGWRRCPPLTGMSQAKCKRWISHSTNNVCGILLICDMMPERKGGEGHHSIKGGGPSKMVNLSYSVLWTTIGLGNYTKPFYTQVNNKSIVAKRLTLPWLLRAHWSGALLVNEPACVPPILALCLG